VTWVLLTVAIGLLGAAGVLLTWTAGRVDRLHTRVGAARAALDAQLFHRSGVALEVAAGETLDPAAALLLLEAAHRARAAAPAEREPAESDLTQILAAVFADPTQVVDLGERPDTGALLGELATACRRVELARRFHNDMVTSARALRRRRIVRWFGLAGRAQDLATVEMDDTVPPAFSRWPG
jgi:hypothetical protein